MITNQKITVVGSGYVGMSLSVLLSQLNHVTVLDIDQSRIDKINNKISTIEDKDIQHYLDSKNLKIRATLDNNLAYDGAKFIIIATPTNFDENTKKFDTSNVDQVVRDALCSSEDALIVIKSTVPVGYTEKLQKKYKTPRIVFSPEFLREGKALYDNLHPSRIIIGGSCDLSKSFSQILKESALKDSIETIFMSSTEAEAVKLFSNTYLAMRVAFFNELDSYAMVKKISTKNIIDGVSLDPRIGHGYNNPSFGYGGYCLPKDTKQMLASYNTIPQSLIGAVISSNEIRIDIISKYIINQSPKSVGFYRLAMKEGSDNFRSSSIQKIIKNIESTKIKTLIYEPNTNKKIFSKSEVVEDIAEFKERSEMIVANRISNELYDCLSKVISRDIFQVD